MSENTWNPIFGWWSLFLDFWWIFENWYPLAPYTVEKCIENNIFHNRRCFEVIMEKIGLLPIPNIEHANPSILFSKCSESFKKNFYPVFWKIEKLNWSIHLLKKYSIVIRNVDRKVQCIKFSGARSKKTHAENFFLTDFQNALER